MSRRVSNRSFLGGYWIFKNLHMEESLDFVQLDIVYRLYRNERMWF